MNYKFKISVVIPVYNCEKFLENCLDSLHAQTMSSDEYQIIFVNDGSTDSSGEICESFTREKNVVYFEKENGGVSSARNKGIELAQGKYILFLDSDDTLSPNTFVSVYNFFEEHYSETDKPERRCTYTKVHKVFHKNVTCVLCSRKTCFTK